MIILPLPATTHQEFVGTRRNRSALQISVNHSYIKSSASVTTCVYSIYTPSPPCPTEGTFALQTPNFCLSYPFPPPPGISLICQLGRVPSGKNICLKDVVALYYYAKDNFLCDKMRKNLFIHFVIRCLIISMTLLANNLPQRRYLTLPNT